jgi:transcriptional regulator with XRE-family HTH domain
VAARKTPRYTEARAERTGVVLRGRIEAIRHERAAAGQPISQRELARDFGISQSEVSRILSGQRRGPQVYRRITTEQYAPVYNVTVETTDPKTGKKARQSLNVHVARHDLWKQGINPRYAAPRLQARPETTTLVRREMKRRQKRLRKDSGWTQRQVERASIISVRRVRGYQLTSTPYALDLRTE